MNQGQVPPTKGGRHLLLRISTMVRRYELMLGPVPSWAEELDALDVLALLDTATRIGIRLPAKELLIPDDLARAMSARRHLRPSKPKG